jgi:alkaline phosphatase D
MRSSGSGIGGGQMGTGAPGARAGLSRRAFVRGAAAAAGLVVVGRLPRAWAAGTGAALDPFSLGVASGDPTSYGVVLWTRLAPDPLAPGGAGGMPPSPVNVRYEIALDDQMRQVVKRGVVTARPETAHTVKAEVIGLAPDRWYWYRFDANGVASRIGRTRTFPLAGASPAQMRFVFASCQEYRAGYYAAWRDVAQQDLDFVAHLGDYIYEGGFSSTAIRQHDGPEPMTLAQYRNRHALYKTDPDLQAAHAAFPFLVTWDDHEVENDYAGMYDQNGSLPADFLARRAQAYQAWWEHMPVTRAVQPVGPDMRIYRRFLYGRLASIHLLDTRQYRSSKACGGAAVGSCPDRTDPSRTMMGAAQESWLAQALAGSASRWNVLGNQTMMANINFLLPFPPQELYNLDQWDGFAANRDRILQLCADAHVPNPVVITGDIHSSWVWDLRARAGDPTSPLVATEFVGCSITSGFPPELAGPATALGPLNPGFKWFDAEHGYVRCTVDRATWRSDYRSVANVLDPNSAVSTRASFVVEDGQPGAIRV